uniref:CSON003004 protein n=1 Tax=Culicoides sonorensis TaxID=179676 RepID=A0A336M4K1_CULSO
MSQPNFIPEGCLFLVDLKGSSLAHLSQINIAEMKSLIFYLTECYPCKIKGAHFINAPFPMLMDRILSLLRPMIRSDLAKEIHVHENVESLMKIIPVTCLPSDYEGGELKSAKELNSEYFEFILKNRKYFLEEPKYRRVNEKLRPEKMKSNMDGFGLDGNFKKLDID